ncbi:hypothetical protein [Streptomyces sp. NPDC007369]|uniref:hypothetical protein n=1 Tax=Streptomyces sp. NPDC007369 TaxID=3154589 RepID=UPI0033E4BF2C
MMDLTPTDLRYFANDDMTRLADRAGGNVHALPLDKDHVLRTVAECRRELEAFLRTCAAELARDGRRQALDVSPGSGPYSIHTKKGDTSIDAVQRYDIRDAVQWLIVWTGLRDDPLWDGVAKLIAFTASLDDICVPFEAIGDGTYLLLGESLPEIIERMRRHGGQRDARWLELAEENIRFAGKQQFYEKWAVCTDPAARCPDSANIIRLYTTEKDFFRACVFRNYSTMTTAVLAGISYYFDLDFDRCDWGLFHAATIGDAIGLDVGKEAQDVAMRCPTNLPSRPENPGRVNEERRRQAHRVYTGINALFRDAATAPDLIYARYSRAALSFATTCDRYVERRTMKRIPMTVPLTELVDRVAHVAGASGGVMLAPKLPREQRCRPEWARRALPSSAAGPAHPCRGGGGVGCPSRTGPPDGAASI